MQNIKLDSRLSTVASMVRRGSRLIDVGTDHGYLPSYLVLNSYCPCAVASDIRPMPLKNADETIRSLGLENKITTVLSDGLNCFAKKAGDDIVIAGMGGLLIADILGNAEWIKDESVRIIAQPMTHAEAVREFFADNGFVIEEEKCAVDARHVYCVIAASYKGTYTKHSAGYTYFGELTSNDDEASKKYLLNQYNRLNKKYIALTRSGKDTTECEKLKEILDDFAEKTEVTKW